MGWKEFREDLNWQTLNGIERQLREINIRQRRASMTPEQLEKDIQIERKASSLAGCFFVIVLVVIVAFVVYALCRS